MGGRLVEHLLQGRAPGLDKVALESADSLLLGGRRHHHTGIIGVQRIVQP